MIQSLAIHLQAFREKEFIDFKEIPIIFQSLRPDVERDFSQFFTGTISNDYAKIYTFLLVNSKSAVDSSLDTSKKKEEP